MTAIRGVKPVLISLVVFAASFLAVSFLWDADIWKKFVFLLVILLMLIVVNAVATFCPTIETTDPSIIQVANLMKIPKNQDFTITNILKYKDKDEYMKYAKWAEKLMAPHGIKRSSGIHEVKFSLIGEPLHEYDEMFSVHYPNLKAAMEYGAITEKDEAMLECRRKGLDHCKLLVSYPERDSF
jgi:hypothetical protein